MHIPDISSELCPSKLLARSFTSDVTSTADSFKSWDTCMDNKTCKIVAIVGIVLAALVCIWILSTVIQCICLGKTCLESLCMCCCRPARHQQIVEPHPYNNPNMYGTLAPYYASQPPAAYTANRGYIPMDEANEKESPFNEDKNASYRGYR